MLEFWGKTTRNQKESKRKQDLEEVEGVAEKLLKAGEDRVRRKWAG